MDVFICKRCGYVCEFKYLLKRHLNRKIPCKILIEDISIDDLLYQLDNKNVKEYLEFTDNEESTEHESEKAESYKCKYCEKKFSYASNMYRHQKTCKNYKIEIEKIQSQNDIEILKAKIVQEREHEQQKILKLESELAKLKDEYAKNKTFESEISKLKDILDLVIKQDNIKTEEYKQKRYTLKEYKFPSGKIVYIQGYESFALNELIKIYNEDDIHIGVLSMPEIWYHGDDGRYHRYFPDIYIPKDNLLIEVKSTFTFAQNKRKVHITRNTCEALGYNFKLKIYDGRGRCLNDY